MIKCAEVGLEPRMKVLRSALALKASSSSKLVIYASYKVSALALMISKSI